MKNTILLPAITAIALLGASCDRNAAKVSGRLPGSASMPVVLEHVTASGNVSADSTTTDRKGNFKMKITLPDSNATFYYLKVDGQSLPLFISPKEHIRITSRYCNPGDYTVEGSAESVLTKEIYDMMNAGASRLDSLGALISTPGISKAQRKEHLDRYVREFGRLKRDQIRFIVTNSTSLAALYALYQRFPNDEMLFSGDNDIIYYRMVADSVSKYHPDSPYVAALRSQIASEDSNEELARMVCESMKTPVSYPDLALPDMYGETRRLSDDNGKVILLDFWLSESAAAAVYNAELKEIYDEYSGRGFEIYQVCLDTSKQQWINAVQTQNLPWISVCDLNGMNGIAPKIYNISQVPANYIIDKSGEIVARNVSINDMRRTVDRLTAANGK